MGDVWRLTDGGSRDGRYVALLRPKDPTRVRFQLVLLALVELLLVARVQLMAPTVASLRLRLLRSVTRPFAALGGASRPRPPPGRLPSAAPPLRSPPTRARQNHRHTFSFSFLFCAREKRTRTRDRIQN